MAFYNSSYYHTELSDYDSYDSTPYDSYYDAAQTDPPITHSGYEPSFSNLFDYPTYYGAVAYDSGISYSANACSAFNFSEPKVINYDHSYEGPYGSAVSFSANACSTSTLGVPTVIKYDPDYWADSYQKVSTQFVVSYSVSEFNEPEFEEYDPTPYGGGYDIAQTYGNPLPPSNEICYPPSSSSAPAVPSLNDAISKGSMGLVDGDEKKADEGAKEGIGGKAKPSNGRNPVLIHEDNENSASQSDTDSEAEETMSVSLADLGSGNLNGRGVESDYDYGRPVNQFPSGYGLEAMDLCESLFGYWPCLSQIKKQTDCGHAHTRVDGHGNPWQTAADYLFGSYYPYPQGQTRDSDTVYGCERYLRE